MASRKAKRVEYTQQAFTIQANISTSLGLRDTALGGCSKTTNIKIIQVFQNKVLRNIVKVPWYVRNENIHKDLGMDTVMDVIGIVAKRHDQRLHNHVNISVLQLLDNNNKVWRLKRTKPSDLVQ